MSELFLPIFLAINGLVIALAVFFYLDWKKKCVQTLGESQEIHEFIDNLPTLVAKIKLDGCLELFNRSVALNSGLDLAILKKTHFTDLRWWQHDEKVRERVQKAFVDAKHGIASDYDEQIAVAGKQLITLNMSLRPVMEHTQVKYIIFEGHDITVQKLVEGKLRDQNDQIATESHKVEKEKVQTEAILESVGDGLVATDKDANVILMNHSARQMLGWIQDNPIGKSYFDVLPAYDKEGNLIPKEKRHFTNALKTGVKTVNASHSYQRRDGSKMPVMVTTTPVTLGKEIMGGIVVFHDITQEREVSRMKNEFISLVSHQLRTPLSAMKWFSEMLLNGDAGKLTDEQHEFIQNISDSNDRMIALVNALLNISRIESGRLTISPEPTDLKNLVDGVLKEVKVKADEKKMKIVVSVNPNMPKINIDPKLIRQVYLNLLTNAIKYSPAETDIIITISKDPTHVISQVSDHGYGIPKEEQAKVFQKFYRGENIIKIETDGTGLGLYLVKSIIESSGGTISFDSEVNKGTSFRFSLPLTGSVAKKGEVSLSE